MRRAALRHLAPGLLVAASLAGCAAAILGFAWGDRTVARAEEARARALATAAQARLARLREEAPRLRATLARFEELRRSDLFGPPQRLAWAQTMHSLVRELRLEGVRFEFAPPRRLDSLAPGLDYRLHASDMVVAGPLAHEGDLLRLLDALRGPVAGRTRPRHCVLERLPPASRTLSLRMQCEITWLGIEAPALPASEAP